MAGLVALVAGIIWGSKFGVQFTLSTAAPRALPVVILGGLTSVPGAILGGLIIGVGEKLSEVYLGSLVGGGIEIWFAYVLALVFLLFRPQGLFGEKIIDRVWGLFTQKEPRMSTQRRDYQGAKRSRGDTTASIRNAERRAFGCSGREIGRHASLRPPAWHSHAAASAPSLPPDFPPVRGSFCVNRPWPTGRG